MEKLYLRTVTSVLNPEYTPVKTHDKIPCGTAIGTSLYLLPSDKRHRIESICGEGGILIYSIKLSAYMLGSEY